MKTLRLSALAAALLIAVTLPGIRVTRADQVPGSPVHDVLDPIIDNGTVQLGINPAGHLNVPGGTSSMPSSSTTVVGLRFIPTNGEATAPGCLCEGWGVANADGSTGTFSGYADISSDGGVVGLVVQPGTGVTAPTGHVRPESVGSAFKSIVTTTNGRLRVTHSFHPSPSPNLYQVDVTIENIGETPIGDLRYRRVMDWDIAPITFQEWVEIHVGTAANVLRATTDGFDSANPLSVFPPNPGSPPTTLLPGSVDYFGGPSDQGALFDFAFGALPAGGTRTFRIYYGAAADRDDALAAIASVGAEVYSLGLPRQAPPSSGAATDGPHAFIFAFSGVGGTSVTNSAPAADSKTVATPRDTPVPITLSGSDAETSPANFIWTVGTPGHGTLTGTAPNLTYTPDEGYAGPDGFTYTVTDRGNPDGCGTPGPECAGPLTSEPATVSITVTGAPGNSPPTATVSLSPPSPKTNDTLTATATKSDVDEDLVTLTFVWKKTTGETTTTLRTYTTSSGFTDSLGLGVPGNGDRGETITVEVTPNDGTVNGAAASAFATVVNSPPVLSVTDQTGTEGVPLSFQVSATDADASDTVTFSASNLPLGATFDAMTRTLAWTPSFAQGGPNPYFVQFTASDGQLADMKTVSLTIADVPGRPDRDGDGVPDDVDNCPDDPNPTQADVCHNSPQPTSGTVSATTPSNGSQSPVLTYNLTVRATGGATSWVAPGLLTGTLHCHIFDSSTGNEVPAERVPEIPVQVMDEDGGILVRVPSGQTSTISGTYDLGLTHPTLPPGAYTATCEYRNLTPRPDPQPGDAIVWIGEVSATTATILVGAHGDFFLHGAGGTANPPTLSLDHAAATGTVAKYKDSPAVNFSGGGNPWKEVGTWSASPSLAEGAFGGLSALQVWLGLRNGDDVHTQFDLRAEVHKNGEVVASGETRCVQGLIRSPSSAKKVTVSFEAFTPVTFDGTTDVLSLKILTRIGTTPSGAKCGPAGSHSSAVGVRLYFDAVSRNAQFSTTP